jgi:carbonic anhydrase
LVEGNKRFVSGQAIHPDQSVERRAVLAGGQAPFAIVLTCSDSRVSPELYFDQGLGNLFVARNAGNVIDNHILGSLEYAVEHLHVHLIVVVGHAKCGAVSAALLGNHEPGHIQSVLNSIASGLGGVKDQPGDQLDAAVRANARRSAELVERSEPILQEAVKAGKLRVVSANYDLASGNVEFFPR